MVRKHPTASLFRVPIRAFRIVVDSRRNPVRAEQSGVTKAVGWALVPALARWPNFVRKGKGFIRYITQSGPVLLHPCALSWHNA